MYCQLRLEAFLDINNLLLLPHICLVCFGLYVLAQLNLSCQAEDSSLKFGIRNREEKVALKRMENVLFAAFIHHRGDPRLACFVVMLLRFFSLFHNITSSTYLYILLFTE